MAERFASVSEDELCEKCIIKQLLNSVFAWYHELSKPRVCVICLSNTDLGFDNSWYHAQPHPIIVYYMGKISLLPLEVFLGDRGYFFFFFVWKREIYNHYFGFSEVAPLPLRFGAENIGIASKNSNNYGWFVFIFSQIVWSRLALVNLIFFFFSDHLPLRSQSTAGFYPWGQKRVRHWCNVVFVSVGSNLNSKLTF